MQWDGPSPLLSTCHPVSFLSWSQVSVASFMYILPEIFYAHVSKLPRHTLSPLFFKTINGKIIYCCSTPCFFLQQNFLKIISSWCLDTVYWFSFALLCFLQCYGTTPVDGPWWVWLATSRCMLNCSLSFAAVSTLGPLEYVCRLVPQSGLAEWKGSVPSWFWWLLPL